MVAVRYRACVTGLFSAAHAVRSHGGSGRYLHGHDFRVRACASAEALRGDNISVDLEALGSALEGLLRSLDHRYLNEELGVEDLSIEYLAQHILARLRERIPEVDAVEVCVGEGRYCVEVRG